MRRRRPLLLAAAFALMAMADREPAAQTPAASGRRFALLVGVTEFSDPAMNRYKLEGAANDVALFRSLLLGDAFGFPASAIVSLSEPPNNAAGRPTRANIERAFRALRDQVRPGDQVVVLLAGHGSQQPADPDPMDEEPDGLDEIFLPADAAGWDESTGAVTNAIVDDDLRQWVDDIRHNGAVVWIIVDACHSGTATRAGRGVIRDRGIPAGTLIPAEVLAAARDRARPTTRRVRQPGAFDFSDSADITALYAADATEAAPELPMPDRNGPVQGLFTYTLSRILSEHTAPLTYRDLMQRVIDRYRSEGFGTTPAFEGSGVDREVLGERSGRRRDTFAIAATGNANEWSVAAGSIHGLTVGSLVEVVSPSEPADAPAHLRVVTASPTTAVATPVAFANQAEPAATRIAPGSRVRVRVHEFGPLRLRVALQRDGVPPADAGGAALERALAALEGRSDGLAEQVAGPDADWFVRVDAGTVVLSNALSQFAVAALDDERLADRLADRMRRVARAANLARVSSYVDSDASLSLRVSRRETRTGSPIPLLSAAGPPAVAPGQFLQFVVRNTGTVPLDITVLYVDGNFGVYGLFPASDSALDNRLDPGHERVLDLAEISGDPLGWESVVAIGVEASPRHENFLSLTQESLAEADRASGARSPVRALLESPMSGSRQSRSTATERSRFAITQTWFHVEQAAR